MRERTKKTARNHDRKECRVGRNREESEGVDSVKQTGKTSEKGREMHENGRGVCNVWGR